mgnify:CR=1 FL=1
MFLMYCDFGDHPTINHVYIDCNAMIYRSNQQINASTNQQFNIAFATFDAMIHQSNQQINASTNQPF